MSKNYIESAIRAGKVDWDEYRKRHFFEGDLFNLKGIDLSGLDLSGYDLTRLIFSKTNLEDCKFDGADFSGSNLGGARFKNTSFDGAILNSVKMSSIKFDRNTSFRRVKAKRAACTNCSFEGVDLSNSDFSNSNFNHSSFLNANLQNTILRQANLIGTAWEGVKINKGTSFYLADFQSHPITSDKSEKIKLPSRLNWNHVRWIKTIPIFQFSWMALAITLYIMTVVKFLSEWLPYEIPSYWPFYRIIFSSCLLLIGSTIFRCFCPKEVQEFSETQWVYAYNHPRQFYLSSILQKPRSTTLSAIITILGGVLLAHVLIFDVCVALYELTKTIVLEGK